MCEIFDPAPTTTVVEHFSRTLREQSRLDLTHIDGTHGSPA